MNAPAHRWSQVLVYICTLFVFAPSVVGQAARTIVVDPFGNDRQAGTREAPLRTWPEAQRRVRAWIAAGLDQDIDVVFRAGVYQLEAPLEFGIADSVPKGHTVTYRAATGETAIISGGMAIQGWACNEAGWWHAPALTELPEPAVSLCERQMFIDDQRLIRAREPDEGYYRVAGVGSDRRTAFRYDPAEWTPPADVAGIEFALLHDWSMSRVPLAEIDRAAHLAILANPVGAPHDFFRIDGFEPNPRYFLEGSLTFLDSDFEFLVERASGARSMKLPASMSLAERRVVAPRLDRLVTIRGTDHQPVRGIRFVGLQFRHTRCPIPPGGYAGIQANFYERRGDPNAAAADPTTESGHRRFPAAIELSSATDCKFESCSFRQLGGGGIYLQDRVDQCEIAKCTLTDVGGCGVMIGETISRTGADGANLASRGNIVRNCSISRCGQIAFGAVGVWIGIAQETMIADNEIFELPYTGISVGWRWDPQPSGCGGNRILRNHIHHVMQILSDGGGIYTLGRQPGTVLEANRIHAIPLNAGRAESNGIFMDEGSSEILVVQNEIYDTERSPIRFHKAEVNTVRDNQLSPPVGVDPYRFNSTDPEKIHFENNRIESARGGTP